MPKVTHNQTNFTAGELSPKLYGRVDIAKYGNGAAVVENCIPLIQGGAINRDGTRYVSTAKTNNEAGGGIGGVKATRLVPFVYSRTQSYILEFGDLYIRFYKDGAPIMDEASTSDPYEIATPFSESMLDDLDFAQQFDTIIIAHRSISPKRLRRFGDAKWDISDVPFTSIPAAEVGYTPYSNVIIDTNPSGGGALVAGAAVKLRSVITDDTGATVNAGAFIKSDVGRYVRINGGGSILLTKFIDKDSVLGEIKGYPVGLSGPQVAKKGDWVLDGSPQAKLTPSGKGPIGTEITLKAGANGVVGPSVGVTGLFNSPDSVSHYPAGLAGDYGGSDESGLFVWTYLCVGIPAAQLSNFKNGDLVQLTDFDSDEGDKNFNGNYKIYTKKNYSAGETRPIEAGVPFFDPPLEAAIILTKNYSYTKMTTDIGLVVSLGNISRRTATSNAIETFREDDVGGVVKINSGSARITSIITPSQVTAEVVKELSSVVSAIPDSWQLTLPCWSDSLGYPGAVTIAGQRLIFAGSPRYPNAVWLSRIAEYFNFDIGVTDTDAIDVRISAKEMAEVRHLAENNGVVVFTQNGEYTILGGVEKPVTPTNIQIKNQSAFGSGDVQPIKIGAETFFLQRGNRKIRAMSYQYGSDSYNSPDVTALSDHLVANGIRSVAYQQEPYSILWIVTKTGGLVSCTVDREQNVIAWARHSSGDAIFESVACIPNGDVDEVWLSVLREDNYNPV